MRDLARKVQVWIFSKKRNCLILKTNEKRGRFWQPVTGSVESHEKGQEGWALAAQREAEEETGFSFEGLPQESQYEFDFETRGGTKAQEKVFAYLRDNEEEPQLDPKEHENFQWVLPKQALTLLKYESSQEGLKASYLTLFKEMLTALFLAFFFLSPQAQASQWGEITSPEAQVRAAPDEDSEVITTLKEGDRIKISPVSRDGWFKVRTKEDKVGWVLQTQVFSIQDMRRLKAASIDLRERDATNKGKSNLSRWAFRGLYGMVLMMPSSIMQRLGRSPFKTVTGRSYLFQIGYYLWDTTKIAVRLENLYGERRMGSYDIAMSSFPLLFGLEKNLTRTVQTKQMVGAFVGFGLGHSFVVKRIDADFENPKTAAMNGTTVMGALTYSYHYRFFPWLMIVAETGVRLSRSLNQTKVSRFFNGAEPVFVEEGKKKNFWLSESGGFLYTGIEVTF